MGPYEYLLVRLDGDYAILQPMDADKTESLLVARALLPQEADEGMKIRYENFCYTILA